MILLTFFCYLCGSSGFYEQDCGWDNPDGVTSGICNPLFLKRRITNPLLFAFGLARALAYTQIRKSRHFVVICAARPDFMDRTVGGIIRTGILQGFVIRFFFDSKDNKSNIICLRISPCIGLHTNPKEQTFFCYLCGSSGFYGQDCGWDNPDGDTSRICNPLFLIRRIINPFLFAFGLAHALAYTQIRKSRVFPLFPLYSF